MNERGQNHTQGRKNKKEGQEFEQHQEKSMFITYMSGENEEKKKIYIYMYVVHVICTITEYRGKK
jgi:hypothetical protein